ncbi:cytosolic sulfotransferase 15-like [Senna tora]|uniref:Sulfotransferase n=1 Tax=Senna tora TaxID=362788 RepID=A0A834X1I8_9FABA|nr:cytosolic sulfotransferase 15-like [Senna tora]
MAESAMTNLTNIESCSLLEKEEEEETLCKEQKHNLKGDDFHAHEEFFLSLPKEKAWGIPIYLYQHFWYRLDFLPSIISFLKHFQPKHDDVFITSFPKSGTTWLKALAFATMKRSCFIPSQDNHPLLHSNPHTLVPFIDLEFYNDPNNVNPDLSIFSEPRLFATHIPFPSLSSPILNSNCKIIYICRNPFDSFISYWHFYNNISSRKGTLEEAFERYCEGIHPFGPFWNHHLGYWKASKEKPNKVLFLKYEDLKENPNFELKRMAHFLDCPFSEEEENSGVIDSIIELCSFGKMKKLEANNSGKTMLKIDHKHFFRKGESGDWVNYISPDMAEKLFKVMEEKYSRSGLSF